MGPSLSDHSTRLLEPQKPLNLDIGMINVSRLVSALLETQSAMEMPTDAHAAIDDPRCPKRGRSSTRALSNPATIAIIMEHSQPIAGAESAC